MRELIINEILSIAGGVSTVRYSGNNTISVEFPANEIGGFMFNNIFQSSIHPGAEIYEAGDNSWFAINHHYFDYPCAMASMFNLSVSKTIEANKTIYQISW